MPHVSVYVDEAGDLGFGSNSSKFFTIGYVFTVNRFSIIEKKVVKRTLKELNVRLRNKNSKIQEFKFTSNTDKIKKKFLCKIKNMDIVAGVFCIEKNSVKDSLKKDPIRMYSYVVVDTIITLLIEKYFHRGDPYNSIRFVIDRGFSKSTRAQFTKYCEDKISFRASQKDRDIDYNASISHEDSREVEMLQVADYIAGVTQCKFQRNISEYYDLIKDKIEHKDKWDNDERIEW